MDRVRPKLMTVFTTLIGLLPVMVGTETGSEVMKRIARRWSAVSSVRRS